MIAFIFLLLTYLSAYLSARINMEYVMAYITFFGLLETTAIYIFDNSFLFVYAIKSLIAKIRINITDKMRYIKAKNA